MSLQFFGLPQPLTGAETVTIQQVQNGQIAKCSMPLSELVALAQTAAFNWSAIYATTTKPSTPGQPWNNNGVLSFS